MLTNKPRAAQLNSIAMTVALLVAACSGDDAADGAGAGGSSVGDGGALGTGSSMGTGSDAGVGGTGTGGAEGSGGAATGGSAMGDGGDGGTSAGGAMDGAASGGTLGGGAGGDAAASGGNLGTGGDANAGPCPAELPVEEASCSVLGLACTYGDDPRWECRAITSCDPFGLSGNSMVWRLRLPPESCELPPLPDECPAAPATGDCTAPPEQCVYDDGTVCLCTDCDPDAPVCGPEDPSWVCAPPPADCPAFPPNEGTACTGPNEIVCQYRCDRRIACVDGLWERALAQCPACAAPDTGIETPSGLRPIEEIRVGDLVFSRVEGVRTAVPVLRTSRAPKAGHFVAKITLKSGIVLYISGGHPTADGRTLDELALGDTLGSAQVTALELVPYPHPFTYDILPDSPNGSYFAEGALIGSTLLAGRRPVEVNNLARATRTRRAN